MIIIYHKLDLLRESLSAVIGYNYCSYSFLITSDCSLSISWQYVLHRSFFCNI